MGRWLVLGLGIPLCACVGEVPAGGGDSGSDGPLSDSGAPPDAGGDGTDSGVPTNVDIKVVNEFGVALTGVKVQIGTATANTDNMGKAQLLAPPAYDVLLAYDSPSVSTKRITMFQGVTTRTPTLQVVQEMSRKTSFQVATTGITFPLAANDTYRVLFSPTSGSDDVTLNPNLQMFSNPNVPWSGKDPNVGKAYAFLVGLNNGLPSTWKSAAAPQNYSFGDAGNAMFAFTLNGAVNAPNISGNLVRNGLMANQLWLWVAPGGGNGRMSFADQSSSATSFTLPVPAGSANVVALGGVTNGVATFAWKANIASGTSGLQIALPMTTLSLQKPDPMATGVDLTTSFNWTAPFPMSRLRVFCPPQGPTLTYLVEVITSKTSATLPNTTGLGATLPSSTSCVWQATSFAGPMTPDDVVQPAGWYAFTEARLAVQDGAQATSGRPFTSK